jgi:ABC-type branched-subunit amino acid transport system substrate-binding protein
LADVGVDVANQVITLGVLADLSGPFKDPIQDIVLGQEVFWESLNARGGIEGTGWTVKLEIADTGFDVDTHVQKYEELKERVAAFALTAGTPHTAAIKDSLEADGILAVPLIPESRWSSPNLRGFGAPLCLEAMNTIEYMFAAALRDLDNMRRVALVTTPAYGGDAAAGVKAAVEALGLELVYDGSGVAGPGAYLPSVADAIVASGADMVYAATTPEALTALHEAVGYGVRWAASSLTWTKTRRYFGPSALGAAAVEPWDGESEAASAMRAAFQRHRPQAPPSSYYGVGWAEGLVILEVLAEALEHGDLTQAGIVAAQEYVPATDFGGLAPTETYTGSPAETLQRQSLMFRPDEAGNDPHDREFYVVQDFAAGELAEDYEFPGECG